ncbi:MAG: WD40/YVTN/BNR-like repeat-containing protein [Candidatus Aminicenantales bacterium]
MKKGMWRTILVLSTAAAAILTAAAQKPKEAGAAAAAESKVDLFASLRYRHIGPVGNRVIAVVGLPGNPNVYYIGAASGGIFKSVDGGGRWEPIFDSQPVSSVGSLAVAPSDPNVVWAGTGEAFIRSNISQGNGIYKSTDAGKTWACVGLENTGRIGRIVIDPRNPDIVFAAAMGHCYGPQQERGVYRTADGGKTWARVLFVDENTGCSDIAMDPNNPRILFAGMWPMLIRTWGKWSGGPGGSLHVSRDGGMTWTRLQGHGLPETEIGKVGLAVAPNDSSRVYALIEAADEGLWRSDDAGGTWKHVNHDTALLNRPLYYTRLVVSPENADEIYFPATGFHMSQDGGKTFKRFSVWGGDNHDMWIDPADPDRMIIGNDQGLAISVNRGKTWRGIELPIAQMYHVYADNRIPYYVYGNRQDGTSYRLPSNSRTGGRIPRGLWHPVGGFESGFAVPDPVDNDIVWSGNYDGMLDRFDLRTMQGRPVSVWPESLQGWPAGEVKYRFQWTFPIAVSPHDHNRVYVGSQFVHMTTDGGQSWQIISPDLTTNDKSKQQRTGGLTADDASPLYACTLFALAESPLEAGQIWAGSNDGRLQLTRDGGKTWTDVSGNIPKLPSWGTVSNIEPSRFKPGTCYVTLDLHQVNDRDPYVFKTADFGATWKNISSNIPRTVLSYAHCVREDPVREGMLYLGVENALYVSFDDGASWTPLQTNLPHAPVHWLTVQEHFNDLVVGTYGRGFWILDDITPLRQFTPEVLKSDVFFFAPRPAYRFQSVAGPSGAPNDPSEGENPPYGASIHYYLKAEPKEDIVITIADAAGKIVRTLKTETEEDAFGDDEEGRGREGSFKVPKKAGINRIWWDLRSDKTEEIMLWTRPLGRPHVGFTEKGWRRFPLGRFQQGPLVEPGVYTIKLKMGDKEYPQTLTVKKDPNTAGTEADIHEQTKIMLDIHEATNAVVALLNRVELIRKQISDIALLLKGKADAEPVVKAGLELDNKLVAFEDFFFPVGITGSGDDLRWPDKFYAKLGFLAGHVGESDFPPTSQQREVHELFKKQLAEQQENLRLIIANDVAVLNKMIAERGIPHILFEL